jgi:octaprenyl-diphosphate synthase
MDVVTDYVYGQKGKQLRPLLVFLSAALNGGISATTRIGAALVELFHVGTLLHDDVIDEATERRGAQSVNARWQTKTAILAGDFLFVHGALIAVKNKAHDFLQVVTYAMQDVGEGEMMQMQKSYDLDTDEPQYIEIIRKKTASLLQACTHIGAMSAGATREQTDTMVSFGRLVGIAFQMRDDVLDYKSERITGKYEGNDIRERKLTLPLIFALQQTDKKEQKHILKLVSEAKETPHNVAAVMDFVKRHGGIEYAEQRTISYVEQAKALLAAYPPSPVKDAMMQLSDYIALRQK